MAIQTKYDLKLLFENGDKPDSDAFIDLIDSTYNEITIPVQTGNNGKYLSTNGTSASWSEVDALPNQTGNNGKYLSTNGTNASWNNLNLPESLPVQTGSNVDAILVSTGGSATWMGGDYILDTATATAGNTINTPYIAGTNGESRLILRGESTVYIMLPNNTRGLFLDDQVYQVDASLNSQNHYIFAEPYYDGVETWNDRFARSAKRLITDVETNNKKYLVSEGVTANVYGFCINSEVHYTFEAYPSATIEQGGQWVPVANNALILQQGDDEYDGMWGNNVELNSHGKLCRYTLSNSQYNVIEKQFRLELDGTYTESNPYICGSNGENRLILDYPKMLPWRAETSYLIGNKCRFDASIYTALKDNTGVYPDNPPDGEWDEGVAFTPIFVTLPNLQDGGTAYNIANALTQDSRYSIDTSSVDTNEACILLCSKIYGSSNHDWFNEGKYPTRPVGLDYGYLFSEKTHFVFEYYLTSDSNADTGYETNSSEWCPTGDMAIIFGESGQDGFNSDGIGLDANGFLKRCTLTPTQYNSLLTGPTSGDEGKIPVANNDGTISWLSATVSAYTVEVSALMQPATRIALLPSNAELTGAINEPLLQTVSGSATWSELVYTDTSDLGAVWIIPSAFTLNYLGGSVTIYGKWYGDDDTSNYATWYMGLTSINLDSPMDIALNCNYTLNSAPSTAVHGISYFSHTFIPNASELTAGNATYLKIIRNGLSDTLSGNAMLVEAGLYENVN
jgi:hypothetical protein